MGCTSKITKDIISDCSTQPIGGIEITAYIFNRSEMSITYDGTTRNKVTDIDLATGKKAYKLSGVNKNIKVGHEAIISDEMAKTFKHKLSFPGFEFGADDVLQFDGMDDIAVIVEYKQKTTDGDGVFVGYGFGSGLFIKTDTRASETNNSVRSFALETRDQEGEPCSQYNVLLGTTPTYATTKAALEALLVAQA